MSMLIIISVLIGRIQINIFQVMAQRNNNTRSYLPERETREHLDDELVSLITSSVRKIV